MVASEIQYVGGCAFNMYVDMVVPHYFMYCRQI